MVLRGKTSGFSLLEMIVVIGVLTVLSGFFLAYTRGGESQVKILVEKGNFIATLYRARSLAIATYQYNPPECGYGIHIFFDETPARRYVLWRDTVEAPGADCNDPDLTRRANGIYDNATVPGKKPDEDVQFFALPQGLKFVDAPDALHDILFIPPDPRVTLNEGTIPGPVTVIIAKEDGTSAAAIKINSLGQVEE